MSNKICFSINSYFQFKNFIKFKKNNKKLLILYIKNYLLDGFDIYWLRSFINLVKINYSEHNIKFYVDAGNNYGLSILVLNENIDYLKLNSNKIILNKIKQIAKKNKVLLNPKFDIVDLSKIKNYSNLKI